MLRLVLILMLFVASCQTARNKVNSMPSVAGSSLDDEDDIDFIFGDDEDLEHHWEPEQEKTFYDDAFAASNEEAPTPETKAAATKYLEQMGKWFNIKGRTPREISRKLLLFVHPDKCRSIEIRTAAMNATKGKGFPQTPEEVCNAISYLATGLARQAAAQ